ncbi:MAG TPA: phosphoribosylanthranilate isomerase [Xanthobacteraceae bacterium]|nr:phosphoribosylanthranilate isomerase [Xanthobacteraceae bacterium]
MDKAPKAVPSKAMVEIKICGIKDLSAMDAALKAGADMVGLVFFPPSPRNVSLAEGAQLAARARGKALVVALIVDADDALLEGIAAQVKPDLLQLHGKETPTRVSEVRSRTGIPVMKALPVADTSDLDAVPAYAAVAERILFDARPPKDATRPGGHGRAFDWTLLARLPREKPVMLSGGLDPENVATAIRTVRPDAVDVSSGVEQSPGVKDASRIAAFVTNARAASAALVTEKAS